jgi:death-on-curing protein
VDAPVFLDKPQVLEIHELQISFFGGQPGIRDEGLLDSAISAPINYFHYSKIQNLFDLAACYAFHISKNHGFVDGNKRAGLASAITFLKINGIPVDISQRKIFKATWN